MAEKATYTHGHHKSVLAIHNQRTIHDSARFLLPHIKPTDKILDLGCGPGTITAGLASLVPQGSVIGGDTSDSVLETARTHAQTLTPPPQNLTWAKIDGNSLPFADSEFDVVYAHQLLQHVADPVGILREMRRVTKPNGIVAARDADYATFTWNPQPQQDQAADLELWSSIYQKCSLSNGAQPNGGRWLTTWAKEAGFANEDVEFSWDCWNYQGDRAKVWGESWRDRVLHSSLATTALGKGIATQEELERVSKAWQGFADRAGEGSWIVVPNGEVLCRVR